MSIPPDQLTDLDRIGEFRICGVKQRQRFQPRFLVFRDGKPEAEYKCGNFAKAVLWAKAESGKANMLAGQILEIINELRQPEGHSVIICCPNPGENELPGECVACVGDFTGWNEKDFRADTLLECLKLAQKSFREWNENQKAINR